MRNRLRRHTAIVATSIVALGSVGGMVTLSATAGASVSTSAKCKSVSNKHYKTPHKDGDKDKCDSHGLDDGDGPTT